MTHIHLTKTQRLQLQTIGLQEAKKQILLITGCFLGAVAITFGSQHMDQIPLLSSNILEARKPLPDIVIQRDGSDMIIRTRDAITPHTWLQVNLSYDPLHITLNPSIIGSDGVMTVSTATTGQATIQLYHPESLLNTQILMRIRGAYGQSRQYVSIGQISFAHQVGVFEAIPFSSIQDQ